MPAWPARPRTVMRGSRLPRHATHTTRPLGSGTIAASACEQARGEEAAGAGRLLLGDRVDDQVAGQRHAELRERAGGHDHARDAALHVARPAPVEPAVADHGGERIRLRPVAARLDVDDVDVAVEQQRAAAAAAAEARDELRAPVERELVGHHRVRAQRGRVGLVQDDVGAVRAQQARPGAPAARAPGGARRRACA